MCSVCLDSVNVGPVITKSKKETILKTRNTKKGKAKTKNSINKNTRKNIINKSKESHKRRPY